MGQLVTYNVLKCDVRFLKIDLETKYFYTTGPLFSLS